MASSDSARFVVQMIMNVYVCKYAKEKISKMATKKNGKRSLKSYLFFFIFSIALITLNQTAYFIFKPRNLYEQIEISRSMPFDKIKAYEEDLKIKIMKMQQMPMSEKITNIRKVQQIVQILTHPARRLSYDTFGQTDTSYAWAFKNHYFLLSTLIGSSIFYIICSFLNMVSDKKGQIKEVFKLQIMVMILLFLWEVQLIMKTETRLHTPTDFMDNIYKAFPIFQRRQMIKIILIPCMNIIKFFYRFYLQSQSEQKFLQISKNHLLRAKTNKVSDVINKISIDEHLQDKVIASLSQLKKKELNSAQIYEYQRKSIQYLLANEGQNILMDDQIAQILRYFMIK